MRARGRPRRAFTLVEVLVSSMVMSILLLAMGSLIVLTGAAFPQGATAAESGIQPIRALDLFAADLGVATSVPVRGPAAIEFSVPDRDSDGIEETIRYEWSGSKGDPLVRTINGTLTESIVSSVEALEFTYATESVTTTGNSEGPVTLLSSSTVAPTTAAGTTSLIWGGFFARPAMPVDAVSWHICRVEFQARTSGTATGTSNVRLRTATGLDLPGSTVLASSVMQESGLSSSFSWQSFALRARNLTPGDGVCLCIEWGTTTNAGAIGFADVSPARTDAAGLTTLTGGLAWDASSTTMPAFRIYGTITAETSTVSTVLKTVGASITPSDTPAVVTSVRLLNEPGA